MAATEVVPGLFRIPLTYLNAYALVGSDAVTLIDAGMLGRHERVLDALAQIALFWREDGEATLRRLAALDFEVAVFRHGDPSGRCPGVSRPVRKDSTAEGMSTNA